jgi:hypothetical protein
MHLTLEMSGAPNSTPGLRFRLGKSGRSDDANYPNAYPEDVEKVTLYATRFGSAT